MAEGAEVIVGRATIERLACTKCGDRVILEAPSVRLGPKVELIHYVNKMAEQWQWQLDDPRDPRCPFHRRGTPSGDER